MSKHYPNNEHNPLENFSLDPEDRLVHATTKRQAMSVVNKVAQNNNEQATAVHDVAKTGYATTGYPQSQPNVTHAGYTQAQSSTYPSGNIDADPSMTQAWDKMASSRASQPMYDAYDSREQFDNMPQEKASFAHRGQHSYVPNTQANFISQEQGYIPQQDSSAQYARNAYNATNPQAFVQNYNNVEDKEPHYVAGHRKLHSFNYQQDEAEVSPYAAPGQPLPHSLPQGNATLDDYQANQDELLAQQAFLDSAVDQGLSQSVYTQNSDLQQPYTLGQGMSNEYAYQQDQSYQPTSAQDYALDSQEAFTQPLQGSTQQSRFNTAQHNVDVRTPQSGYAQDLSHNASQDAMPFAPLGQGGTYTHTSQHLNHGNAQHAQAVEDNAYLAQDVSRDSQLVGKAQQYQQGTKHLSQQDSAQALVHNPNQTEAQPLFHNKAESKLLDSKQHTASAQDKLGDRAHSDEQSLAHNSPLAGVTAEDLQLGQGKDEPALNTTAQAVHEGIDKTDQSVTNSVSSQEAKLAAGDMSSQDSAEQIQGNFLYKWREQRRAEKKAKQERKEAIKAGLIPKPSFMQRLGHSLLFLFSLGWKVGIAGLCISAGMFIYFDSVVIDEYEVDDKWVLPAVVYSRPLELYPDQRLSMDQMVYELKLLKYREVKSPRRQGEYALNKESGRIVLIKRQFQFPEGEEPAMSVLIEFDGSRVAKITNVDTQEELAYLRMDPVLLDRINRINPQEDRIFITLDEVPPQLITTLIEIEDRSYFSHMGINPMAIGRAFVKNLLAGGVVEGGSTITQQLVKNYFLTNERSYSRKLKEIFMAISMNHRYTKEQILEAYMNEIYLGQNGNAGIYGFGLASYFYFGVPVAELSLDQMALLVGLIKGPSYYDPWRHPENALERRNTVLAVLRNRGHISPERFEQESQKPLNVIARGQLNYSRTPAFIGLLKTEIGTRFKEEEERTGKDFLSGNGIRIFTSLDPQAQMAAENAVQHEIAAIEKERKLENLEAAMIVSSWRTGEISAVVGSSNPKFDGYNRVLDSRRQVGSLIKPFVYLTAIHQGYHLGSIVQDSPVKVQLPEGKIWAPRNDDKKFRGPIRVINAMAKSLNVPTVRVGMGSGLDNVINTLRAVGFKRKVDTYPSILLGTPEMSPYELNSMYVGMATDGIYQDLTTLRTIVKNGEIVYQRGDNRQDKTLDPKDTYLALYGMTEATRSGTGRQISKAFPDVTIASKTGTTNDFRDSWTVGMDANELATVWVGFDNNKSTKLYGSTGAMRLYIAYLKDRGVNSLQLVKPDGVSFVNFDKQGNVLAYGCEEEGMENYPAREDRIHFIKQCNNFGEAGYEELPFAIPNRPMQSQGQSMPQGQYQTYPAQPGQAIPQSQSMPQGQYSVPQGQSMPQGQYPSYPAQLGQGIPTQQGMPTPPNMDALNSSHVEDSKAQDVDPVVPDSTALPTQSSSSQADSFEEQLLGL